MPYGIHSITGHPAAVTVPPLPQPKLALDLATPRGCKVELTRIVVTSEQSVMAGIRTRDRTSQIRCPNHYTTESPRQVAQLWQRDHATLASFSINVQLNSKNNKIAF